MKVWIINHYAIPPSLGGLVRHYYFSKYLQEKGHEVKIFTASKIHNTDVNMITDNKSYIEKDMDGVIYAFVRTSDYKGNGIDRIINMLQFPIRIWSVCRKFEKPDVIYTSSPSPLTAVSAVIMAKVLKVKKVVEIRDLWPESIVEYNEISRRNPIIQILYQLEKWLYKNADELIFTMEGGKKYIKERGWAKEINPQKIYHINNGVDLEEFEYSREHFQIEDEDLENEDIFKVVYAGSIRKVNNLEILIESARLLKQEKSNIKFLIWGDGNEKQELEKQCNKLKLKNIVFKGKVEKKYIPYIVSKADVNFMHGKYTGIMRFGCSSNKLFDYLAAGKTILTDINPSYNLVEKYHCGVTIEGDEPEKIVEKLLELEKERVFLQEKYENNAKELSKKYDFKLLTNKLEEILQKVEK
ncbi:glycosyltransferase family 4 protein [Acetivibrio ethanolgignens]|uniref:Glycosyltransferase WbuB n=1 Tax=Acetivibrio ethanolgignens TaxID=290052 RepID=A0A0V8QA90_9FIRM|nr:glycosyltransferase family 4 protein [Acetivibrio ethanolgignens]KSV57490.1 hypothetical protein ASU35_04755 [Acetivibrio ethanolgignens]